MNIHEPYLSSGAKPIFRRGGTDAGCLCLHGFSAAPTEISWLGDHLHERLNMTVYTPRLAGHGTAPHDMRRMRWRDWYISARDGYELLASQCERVFVTGISMGGLLALMLAAAEDVEVNAAAVIAAPLVYTHNKVDQARLWKWVRPMVTLHDDDRLPNLIREEQARRGEPVTGRTHYKQWSVWAVAELADLTQVTRDLLPNVTAPLSLIYALNDPSVSMASIDYVREHSHSDIIEHHVLNECGHIITQDTERDEAFEVVEAFFHQHMQTITE